MQAIRIDLSHVNRRQRYTSLGGWGALINLYPGLLRLCLSPSPRLTKPRPLERAAMFLSRDTCPASSTLPRAAFTVGRTQRATPSIGRRGARHSRSIGANNWENARNPRAARRRGPVDAKWHDNTRPINRRCCAVRQTIATEWPDIRVRVKAKKILTKDVKTYFFECDFLAVITATVIANPYHFRLIASAINYGIWPLLLLRCASRIDV